MSDLLRLLDLGAGALQASQSGIALASNNAANVNTEGYSRQSADMVSQRAAPLVGGVMARGPLRPDLNLFTDRERDGAGNFGYASSASTALGELEGAMTGSALELSAFVARMFGAFAEASAAPLDENLRASAVSAANNMASAVRQNAAAIEQARGDADARVREQADQATALAAEVAELNRLIVIDKDPVLMDKRDLATRKLSELVGGRARIDPDGQLRFVLSGGGVLVDGQRASKLVASTDPALGGMARIDLVQGAVKRDVTGDIDGGRLAGDLWVRDDATLRAAADLDQLAFDLATEINNVHRASAARDGSSGRDLFIAPGAPAGAAAALQVDKTVAGDPALLALGTVGAGAGDNGGALGLLALRDQPLAAGGTRSFTDEAIGVAVRIGREVDNVKADLSVATARMDTLAGVRDTLAGVSTQEEMMKLAQYQHAATAATQFLSTVDSLLGRILEAL